MRALSDKRGLTLIEVMMAMLISFIVFLGLSETVLLAVNANVRNLLRDEGVRVAETEINAARTLPFDNVYAGSPMFPAVDNAMRTLRFVTMNYRVARSVTNVDANMKQVVITVSWTRKGHTVKEDIVDNTVFTTILRKR